MFGLNAQTKIRGFGKLKLGSTTEILNDMGYSKIERISNDDDYYEKVYDNPKAKKIFELIADTNEKYQVVSSSLDKRVRVFKVPKYSVTKNIKIESVELTFFNDSLIYIQCDYNEQLTEALTIKYGEPEIDIKEKEKQFTSTYTGNAITKIEETFTSEWQTNDSMVSCRSFLKKYYNSDGEERFISYVSLSDISHFAEIMEEEKRVKERIKNRELLEKKKALEGF